MKNLNLLYNKIYYDSLPSFQKIGEYNKTLLDASFNPQADYRALFEGVQTFCLETVYPGMILGSGNPHGAHASDDDLQMGFSFDYVTGQPYIPGSSVKGVLRSCFEQYPDVIKELTNYENVNDLIPALFESEDVFLDAVVRRGDSRGKLIGEDYITPHPDPVKDPIPIHIIKILPEVQFEFRFVLKDSKDIISAGAKLMLFQKLLEIFGIGAKTNVGYGAFAPPRAISANSSVSSAFASDDRTMIQCPHCGAKNYKYKKAANGQKSDQINDNWRRKSCWSCKRRLI